MGNTPTCVGKTEVEKGSTPSRQKHPHVRGEDLAPINTSLSSLETPPRAWGRLPNVDKSALLARNTPTCVGKTWAT